MGSRRCRCLRYFCGALLALVHLPLGASYAQQDVVDLLEGGTSGTMPKQAQDLKIKPGVAQRSYEQMVGGSSYRQGRLKWDVLMSLIKNKTSDPIVLKLLPGVEIEFTPKSYDSVKGKKAAGDKRFRWVGRVASKGKVVGHALFIVDETLRRITATIEYNDKVYEIVPLKNGDLRIYEFDPTRFPEDILRPHQSTNAEPHVERAAPSETESPVLRCVIDVLVLYTQMAEETWLAQGHVDIWEEFDKAIEITKEALANSQINAEVQITRRELVPLAMFQESGSLDSDLGKLQDAVNWELGKVAKKLRDITGADLVSLWVAGGDWCGAAPYFTRRPPSEGDGYSVVTVTCGAENKSFAHEFGHNLGARHTRSDEGVSNDDTDYNFGHVSVNDRVRTIMATKAECEAQNVYCRREFQYSNPDIPYPGLITMTGVKRDDAKAADNHHQLNKMACKVAAFRQAPNRPE